MVDDVLLGKRVSLERCIMQARRYYSELGDTPLEEDYLRQDAIALNIQRACELALDMANRVIKTRKLGMPQESRESFTLLEQGGVIDRELATSLRGMVGFRNVLVHRYQDLDIGVLREVLDHRLDDLLTFANRCTVDE